MDKSLKQEKRKERKNCFYFLIDVLYIISILKKFRYWSTYNYISLKLYTCGIKAILTRVIVYSIIINDVTAIMSNLFY